jgi:hypothetical protein
MKHYEDEFSSVQQRNYAACEAITLNDAKIESFSRPFVTRGFINAITYRNQRCNTNAMNLYVATCSQLSIAKGRVAYQEFLVILIDTSPHIFLWMVVARTKLKI